MQLQLLCNEYSSILMKDVLMKASVCLPSSTWNGMYCNIRTATMHACIYVDI